MGTIVTRKRKDGSSGFAAQILIKREGVIVHRESRTFDRRPAATAWLTRREAELRAPGNLEAAKAGDPTLSVIIDRYIADSRRDYGRSKLSVLAAIKAEEIGEMRCSAIGSADIISYARRLSTGRAPQTVGNYLAHLGAVFAIARPAWGYPLDQGAMRDAAVVAKRLGLTTTSRSRNRRPTLDELDKLLAFFVDRSKRRVGVVPMATVILFALFSTRRQEEITRLQWRHLDEAHARILVEDMKHPGDKAGNDVWVDLPEPAMRIVRALPRTGDRLFPYTTDAISAAFTRACAILGIEDLHFHDLRHEGVLRLFEMGLSIPHVATVSGHRSWTSLKRYAHLRHAGDRYAEWHWLKS